MSVKEAILGGSTEVFLSRRGVILAHLPPPGEGKLAILGSFWLHMSVDLGHFWPLWTPPKCVIKGVPLVAHLRAFSPVQIYMPRGGLLTLSDRHFGLFWPFYPIFGIFCPLLATFSREIRPNFVKNEPCGGIFDVQRRDLVFFCCFFSFVDMNVGTINMIYIPI